MADSVDILEFAETLIRDETDTYCSELQRQILIATLQGERKTYDQLADECGYSAKYVKQDVAPKLWQLLSHALDEKVHKSNVRAVLEQKMRQSSSGARPVETLPPAPASLLPTWSAPAFSQVGETTASAEAATAKSLSAATILLVDDQPKNLRLLSDLLEEQGYDVQQAINGAVALQAVAIDQPNLILLDINMPDMDGYTVCQQLKADPATQDIPVIFVSALDEAWDKVRAFSVGGVDYITKPFKVVEVLARVESQLKIQQLQQELRAQNAQLQQAIQELQRLAAIDELTQVSSRRRLDSYLQESWQQANQAKEFISLMLIHVGNLDGTDDGAEAGDRMLQQVAQAAKRAVQGPTDLVGRYGTFTFAVVLPQQTDVAPVAQAVLKQIECRRTQEHQSDLTISIGIATVQPSADVVLDDLVSACDRALQEAQSQNRTCIVGPGLGE